jgi:hypothetical protein
VEYKTQLAMNTNIKNKIAELFVEKSSEVLSSFPSLYSKDDVHTVITKLHNALENLLEGELANGLLDDSVEPKYTFTQIKEAINKLDVSDFTSFESYTAEFSLNGNEIELDNVETTINTRDLIDVLQDTLNEVVANEQ